MCQRVYIASQKELPLVKRSQREPFLQVEGLTNAEAAVRRHFRREFTHFYVAGAHMRCGCGFPAYPSDPQAKQTRIPEEDRKSVERLRDYLGAGLGKRRPVQLYLCWPGDEGEAPRNERSIKVTELENPEFRFRTSEILTVHE
jgi:hypothetical protein